MTLSKTWNNTSYSIPEVGEFNWQSLTSFLADLSDYAQATTFQKIAIRVATTSPVTVSAANDCIVVTNLGVAGAVTVNLPAGATKQLFFIVDGKGDAATNNITVTPAAGNINGAASYVINVNKAGIGFIYDGTQWTVFAEFGNTTSGTGTIPRNKLAAGTADHVIINDGSGLLSSEAQLASTRGGTGVSNAGSLTYGANNITITTSGVTAVTFPASGTLATLAGVESLSGKTLVTPLINGGSIDVDAAGALTVGGSVGANNLNIGGATTSVIIPGNLTVSGTTTSINSTNTDVADKNITVNKGGNDASSEGAGITVDRTGADGSFIYKDASATKFALGAIGAEVDAADISTAQVFSNKSISGATNTLSNIPTAALSDATLQALGAYNTNGLIAQTAADTFTGRTITGTANRVAVTNGDGVSGNPTLDIGTDVVTLAGTQAVTNKDIDGGTASNTSRITLPKETTANLNALTRKQGTIVYDTTTNEVKYDDGSVLTALAGAVVLTSPMDAQNYGFSNSVGASALTIALKTNAGSDATGGDPIVFAMRNATSATGTYLTRTVTGALSIVVSSGATLGHGDGKNGSIYVYAIDNAGTIELAVSTLRFNDAVIASTTAMSSSADSPTVLYSTTARTNVAIKLIGQLTSNQTTAGTYAAVPTRVSVRTDAPYSYVINHFPLTTQGFDYDTSAIAASRLANVIKVQGSFRLINNNGSAVSFKMPTGYTIDTAKLNASYDTPGGYWTRSFGGSDVVYSNQHGLLYYDVSIGDNTRIYLAQSQSGGQTGYYNTIAGNVAFNSTDVLMWNFEFPILEFDI